jgi:hypothetical protein
MSQSQEFIWETFDGLFKTVYRQGKRVEELEARIQELEKKLQPEPPPDSVSGGVDNAVGF